MSLRHLGGALTPGQEFVCFRCRIGVSGPNTRLARRNVQTESQSRPAPSAEILGSISSPSRDEKSTPGATLSSQLTGNKIRRVRYEGANFRKIATNSISQESQGRSQVATDARNASRVLNASNAGYAFRKFVVRLKCSQRPRRRPPGNLRKPAKNSPSTSNHARQTIDAPKEKVQDEHQESTTTKKVKAKSSKLTSKVKASDDARETEAKSARIKRKDSNLDKSAVGTNIMNNELKFETPSISANAAEKMGAEMRSLRPQEGTLADELQGAIIPAKAKEATAEQETRQKSPEDTKIASKLREKAVQVNECKVAPSLGSKISSPGHAGDKSQDAIPAETRAQKVPVNELSSVKTVVQMRGPPKRAGAAVAKSQNTMPAKTRKPEGMTRKSPVVKKRRGLEKKAKVKLVRAKRSLEGDASQPETSKLNVQTVKAEQLDLAPLEFERAAVPTLSYGLDRVLFNPGVYHLQDQRSRVFNFDPYLQTIMPVAEFDFDALKAYVTSSKDQNLKSIAEKHGKRYRGSSSSMTAVLGQFHFLLSRFRRLNLKMLSKGFPDKGLNSFTLWQRIPAAIFLMKRDGSYAIDADKQFDSGNILSHLGKAMEKLLTLDTIDYERYRKSNPEKVSVADREAPETFHYSTMGDLLMRSQLDAHDHRLPGSGMFDLKTRAVVSIRMDVQNHQNGLGYEIKSLQGEWESYEREYYDMIRSAFLKYSLQVRMGRMDGVFVAFHNVERIFGFQYISLAEMDVALHGQFDTTIGDKEFKLSLSLLNQILDRATEKYPDNSLRIHFEAREGASTYMYIFAEPVTEEQAEAIQATNAAKVREFEQALLGHLPDEPPSPGQEERCNDWAKIEASVKEAMHTDELSVIDGLSGNDISSQSMDSSDNKIPHSAVEDNEVVEHSNDAHNSPAASDSNAQIENTDNVHVLSTSGDGVLTKGNTQEPDKADTEDFNVSADAEFLDSTDKLISAMSEVQVCAWTLSIRNKVNGVFIDRPDRLTSSDKWEVDYSLTEVTDPQRARILYQACQIRRQQQVEKDDGYKQQSKFFNMLRELSRLGADLRKKLDEAEKGKPKITLTSMRVPQEQHKGNTGGE